MPYDGGVYPGAGHFVSYLAAREGWQPLDAGRVVALVGYADEGVARSGEVDHLGGAREEGGYAHEVLKLPLAGVAQQGGLADIVHRQHAHQLPCSDDGQGA